MQESVRATAQPQGPRQPEGDETRALHCNMGTLRRCWSLPRDKTELQSQSYGDGSLPGGTAKKRTASRPPLSIQVEEEAPLDIIHILKPSVHRSGLHL